MKVRATKPGYFNGLRLPETESEEFEVPTGTKGSWFEPVKKAGKSADAQNTEQSSDQGGAGEGTV